jgi:hypothetical protein
MSFTNRKVFQTGNSFRRTIVRNDRLIKQIPIVQPQIQLDHGFTRNAPTAVRALDPCRF